MKNINKFIFLLIVCFYINYSFSQDSFILYNNINDTIKLSDETNIPALIIFSADWCNHCVSLKKDISNNNLNEIEDYIVCIIDIDFDEKSKNRFRIKTLPTSVIIHNNKEITRKIGYINTEYKIWLDANK